MVDGLAIVPDFVTEDDEAAMLALVYRLPGPSHHAARMYQRFGALVYGDRRARETPPEWLQSLGARLPMSPPDEYTINHWPAGSGLAHHTDRGGPIICIVSLMGAGVLQFAAAKRASETAVCPRRGLCVMAGLSRTVYTHAVMPSPHDRISLVFRTLN